MEKSPYPIGSIVRLRPGPGSSRLLLYSADDELKKRCQDVDVSINYTKDDIDDTEKLLIIEYIPNPTNKENIWDIRPEYKVLCKDKIYWTLTTSVELITSKKNDK